MWRVMIADDEPYIREGLEKLIPWEALGCELIYVAENGQDLLEQIRSCPPDIAIIDIKMPLMDGMEVAEYIYKNHIRSIKKLSFVFRFSLYDQEIQMGVFYWISEVPCIVANICRINFIRHCRNHRHYHRLLLFPFHCHRNYCLHQRPLRFRCPDRQKYPLSYLQGQEMR